MDVLHLAVFWVGVAIVREMLKQGQVNEVIMQLTAIPILSDVARCPAPHRRAFVDALVRSGKLSASTADDLTRMIDAHAATLDRNFHRLLKTFLPRNGVIAILVYPEYGYVSGKSTPPDRAHIESTVHAYLQSMSQLPATLPDMCSAHKAIYGPNCLEDRKRSRQKCIEFIAGMIGSAAFAHVALCGHGTAGSIWLRNRTRLTQRDVVSAADRAGFRGHLLLSINACESSMIAEKDDPWEAPDDLRFDWTVISSARSSQKPSNADRFARTMAFVAPLLAMTSPDDDASSSDEDDGPGPWGATLTVTPYDGEDLRALVLRAWDAAADPTERPEDFIPPPEVRTSCGDWRWTGAQFKGR